MVTQIKAFAASDGTVFASYYGAAEYEARKSLSEIGDFNEGIVTSIINNREKVKEALQALFLSDEGPADAEHG